MFLNGFKCSLGPRERLSLGGKNCFGGPATGCQKTRVITARSCMEWCAKMRIVPVGTRVSSMLPDDALKQRFFAIGQSNLFVMYYDFVILSVI
jgi:hypothetical protein